MCREPAIFLTFGLVVQQGVEADGNRVPRGRITVDALDARHERDAQIATLRDMSLFVLKGRPSCYTGPVRRAFLDGCWCRGASAAIFVFSVAIALVGCGRPSQLAGDATSRSARSRSATTSLVT